MYFPSALSLPSDIEETVKSKKDTQKDRKPNQAVATESQHPKPSGVSVAPSETHLHTSQTSSTTGKLLNTQPWPLSFQSEPLQVSSWKRLYIPAFYTCTVLVSILSDKLLLQVTRRRQKTQIQTSCCDCQSKISQITDTIW